MLIDNSELTKNHRSTLREEFENATRVFMASPFLMEDFTEFFDQLPSLTIASLTLVTTFHEKERDALQKIESFDSLFDIAQSYGFDLTILIDPLLHGKVYIFENSKMGTTAYVTSANFTIRGLARNHEWGVKVGDKESIALLEQQLVDNAATQFPLHHLKAIKAHYYNYLTDNPLPSTTDRLPGLPDISNLFPEQTYPLGEIASEIWLKPYGHSADPIPLGTDLSEVLSDITFSRRRPASIQPGDLLIVYAVSHHFFLGVAQVESLPEHATPAQIQSGEYEERFPWHARCNNLTKSLSEQWSHKRISLQTLRDDFLTRNPGHFLTPTATNLNALQFGHDKIRLHPKFGTFLIEALTGRHPSDFA